MAAPLLETKFFLPRPQPGLVPRRRLHERLDRVLSAKLLVVSAPAGFGKTTLVGEWASLSGPPDRPATTWLSLDGGDNDPATFWACVIAALGRVVPGAGAGVLRLLRGTQRPSRRAVVTSLLDDLGTAPDGVVLVLDDYHVIGSVEVQAGMELLLEHLPPQLRVVIISRADPALPLTRLRARGDLAEIRAADLRFTVDEATAYLNRARGLSLPAADVAALRARTGGSIAALQLAALSMPRREDDADVAAAVAGDELHVVDHLIEEVLRRQPASVRDFLLRTSVLDRLTGPLCDALTGRPGGRLVLDALDREQLFLVPLDDNRQWYRYHDLFADALHTRLLDEQPERVVGLHRLASDWYHRNGDPERAIRHALAGDDFARAASLVELELPALRRTRRETTLRCWLESLPEELVRSRPILAHGLAGALLSTGIVEGVEELLDDAERCVARAGQDGGSPHGVVVVDDEQFRRLPAGIAVHRAGLALLRGDGAATVAFAGRALELARDDDHLARGAASALRGLAAWASGDLSAAHASYAACLAEFAQIGTAARSAAASRSSVT